MGKFVHTEDIWKEYYVGSQKIEAVRGVNLRIDEGDFVVILGHSGSGKTTLISMIGGLTHPTHGKVYVGDKDIWSMNDKELSLFRNKKIGFIFQSFSLLASLTVLDNIIMPVIFNNDKLKDKKPLMLRVNSILSELNMVHKINSYPSELSGGEQRRVAIARALINDPDIILADEPTGELDIRTEREVIEIFKNINEIYQKTIIIVSHSLAWVKTAKRVIVMKDGLVHEDVIDPFELLMEGTEAKKI